MHVFNFKIGQVAVLNGLTQHHAGVGGVDMAVGNVVVLDHNNGVTVGLKEGAQAGNAGIGILVQQELGAVAVFDVLDLHQVVGKNALACGFAGYLGLGGDLGTGDDLAAVEHLLHALKDQHDALTAGVHDTGLFQHGQQVRGVVQRGLTGLQRGVPHGRNIQLGALGGLLGSQTGDGQDRALGGLHDGLVGGLDALLQGGSQVSRGCLGLVLQRLGEAAEQKARDSAGVAAGAAQHGGGSGLAGLGHGAAVGHGLKLGAGGADGHAHVRAGITVRNGENVQLIHAGALVGNVVGAGKNGVAQGLASNHGFVTPHIFWVKQSLVGNDVVHVDIDAGDL